MVIINEFLPNPEGSDSENEWIELWNNSAQAINLNGWRLKTDKKEYILENILLAPNEYIAIPRKVSGLVLRNTNGKVYLLNHQGTLVDQLIFYGKAPEGKSVAHSRDGKSSFRFLDNPSPGLKNFPQSSSLINSNIMTDGQAIDYSLNSSDFLILVFSLSLFLSCIIFYAVKKSKYLYHLLFARD